MITQSDRDAARRAVHNTHSCLHDQWQDCLESEAVVDLIADVFDRESRARRDDVTFSARCKPFTLYIDGKEINDV